MHKCPIDGCKEVRPNHLLMCGDHWRCVPKSTQRAIYAAWNRGNPPDREKLLRFQMEAIDYVNAALKGERI